jgi:hypothetical protein
MVGLTFYHYLYAHLGSVRGRHLTRRPVSPLGKTLANCLFNVSFLELMFLESIGKPQWTWHVCKQTAAEFSNFQKYPLALKLL